MEQAVTNSQQAAKLFSNFFEGEDRELCFLCTLNAANIVTGIHLVSMGFADSTGISSRFVARTALINNAKSVILAHNHPSCNVAPSKSDLSSTEKIRKALELLEICLLDHIIVSGDGIKYYSFTDESSSDFKR